MKFIPFHKECFMMSLILPSFSSFRNMEQWERLRAIMSNTKCALVCLSILHFVKHTFLTK